MILVFAGITYFLSNTLSDSQYSAQDMLMEYQNFVLYQMMVEDWNQTLDQKQKIINDLQRMNLSAYIGIYADINKNQELDLGIDTLLNSWSYHQNKSTFDVLEYDSIGDNLVLGDSLGLGQNNPQTYASYGFFGPTQLPATFVEFPSFTNSEEIVGYWLITDYPLPPDISWPEIVLIGALIAILTFTFLIIRTFLSPIQTMIRHVQQLKRGTLNERIPITSNDELGELSYTINKMTEDINVLVSQKQNLLIDVSHELKTPLTRLKFIVANMSLTKEDKQSLDREINFLKDMISNMLLSDKLSTPYIEDLEKEEIKLGDLIKSAYDMFYQLEQKLKLYDYDETITLVVDPYKMSLAIKNLIDNALKYGGSNQLIELSINNSDKELEIAVTDFGAGIAKEQVDEITKPLYRGRAAEGKNKTGFGLGLAITKKIVEAHNGKLIIQSKINEGSTFVISLPKKGK